MAGKMTMAEKLASRVQPLAEETAAEAAPVDVDPPAAAEPRVEQGDATISTGGGSELAKKDVPTQKRKPAATAAVPERATPTSVSAPAQLILELPESVNRRLASYRAKTRKSHAFVLLKAVESTYDRLPQLVKTALGEEDEPTIQLFERSARTASPVRAEDDEPTFTHSIRTTINNRKALSALAEELGAPSRNFLLVQAYNAFLPGE
ncbi:hypothetical protein [Microbacterium sp. W4I20]|uniref:hypothetical protein n=1 Tax=Microbacterium sp. W4I20 TaxID=3042262 RepID=UPI0027808C96|nr:hypothetical protein [Microbacterium sp. W4I20]MDQ0729095.1 hypothetical protein [Microbacterium sp. W4I20]